MADYYRPRSFPLAFGDDPNVLYFASNVVRDAFGIYSLDLAAGKPTDFAVEVDGCDLALPGAEYDLSEKPLVFDRQYRMLGVRQPGQKPGTRWFDAVLARVQGELESAFPGRTASILEWDGAKKRFLVLVTGPGDPGRYYVYQTGRPGQLMEFVCRAPALRTYSLTREEVREAEVKAMDDEKAVMIAAYLADRAANDTELMSSSSTEIGYPGAMPETRQAETPFTSAYTLAVAEPFAFDTAAGVRLTGSITLPKQHRGKLPPLLVYCRDFPDNGPVGLEFDSDVEALADCGLMVVQVNYRGTPGFGLKHRDAVRETGFDRASVEDIRATISWVAGHYRFDRKRVALFGEGIGGCVALRTLQLYPKEFRCGATLDSPVDLSSWVNEQTVELPKAESWADSAREPTPFTKPPEPDPLLARRRAFFDMGAEKLKAMSVLQHAEQIAQPVLLVQDKYDRIVRISQATDFYGKLKSIAREAEYYEYYKPGENKPDNEYLLLDTRSMYRPKLMVRIGAFLMENLYKYRVDIGEVKEER